MVGGTRWRRLRRGPETLLSLQRPIETPLSHTISCWYCDFKITAFNYFLYHLGHKHARLSRVWFAIGVGFCLITLIVMTLVLLREISYVIFGGLNTSHDLSVNWFFGMSQTSNMGLSLVDIGVMIYSTWISVMIHEFGHALAATSQGIEVEYIALFMALIFPGAFVAFNYDALHSSSLMTALRIYCAGIWHNAVLCAMCASLLYFLPTILHPLYLHDESPVVLNVATTSPLSSYLSQGDAIVSLDGKFINNPHQWREMLIKMDGQFFHNSTKNEANGKKGYCVPNSWLDMKIMPQPEDDSSCPDELTTFVDLSCLSPYTSREDNATALHKAAELKYCLIAGNVVKHQKCGDGWNWKTGNRGVCKCLEGESCMAPVEARGTTWVEISIRKLHSPECLNSQSKSSSLQPSSSLPQSSACRVTFVFVGDAVSLVDNVLLSAYEPRWMAGAIALYVPFSLKKVLTCTLHVSASLALFNSLPAFFLDGESIVEACFLSITWLRMRWRRRLAKAVLLGGSFLVFWTLLQMLFIFIREPL